MEPGPVHPGPNHSCPANMSANLLPPAHPKPFQAPLERGQGDFLLYPIKSHSLQVFNPPFIDPSPYLPWLPERLGLYFNFGAADERNRKFFS